MRDLPRSTRVAIATLYLRYRDARRSTKKVRERYGPSSTISLDMRAREVVIWNYLHAVFTNIMSDHIENDPRNFIRLATMRGKLISKRKTEN